MCVCDPQSHIFTYKNACVFVYTYAEKVTIFTKLCGYYPISTQNNTLDMLVVFYYVS